MDGAGYWILTDQRDAVSLFHALDRRSREHLGTFRGNTTANTDGMTFVPGPAPGFPEGAVYAVHDDQALAAFDWGEVARALGLADVCTAPSR